MIRWLERNGYNVSYISSVDTNSNPALLRQNHKLFVSSGHDEYWSAAQRASMEAARDAGTTNLAFFSGNTGFWKTRFGPSQSGPADAEPDADVLQGHALRASRPGSGRRSRAPGATRGSRPRRTVPSPRTR